jgi:hypothetical protein
MFCPIQEEIMVPENAGEGLLQVAQHILEEAAFIFTELRQPFTSISGPCVQASLEFTGPTAGRLIVRAPRACAELLATNLLGAEAGDQVIDQMAGAAMGELLNMIGGILMDVWFKAKEGYHLGIPEIRDRSEGVINDPQGLSHHAIVLVTEEQYLLEIHVYFK